MTQYGTSYFRSIPDAVRYYADYEDEPEKAVARKVADGEIHIGEPPVGPHQSLSLVDNGTRYAITIGGR